MRAGRRLAGRRRGKFNMAAAVTAAAFRKFRIGHLSVSTEHRAETSQLRSTSYQLK
jgi:hypothetical protein